MTFRCVLFKARYECVECGSVIFVDGPMRTVRCDACKSNVTIPDDFWEIVGEADQDWDSLLPPEGALRNGSVRKGVALTYSRGKHTPACQLCQAPLDLSIFRWNIDTAIHCGQCGHRMNAFPTPQWLVPHAGRGRYIFGALTEGEIDDTSQFGEGPSDKPVAMACINCGAKLDISPTTPRISTCEYCESDYYVPEAVWFQLHARRRRRPWFVAYWD